MVDSLVSSAASIDARPQEQSFEVLEEKHADESEAQNDQHKNQVHEQEQHCRLLLCHRVGNEVVSREADDDQDN